MKIRVIITPKFVNWSLMKTIPVSLRKRIDKRPKVTMKMHASGHEKVRKTKETPEKTLSAGNAPTVKPKTTHCFPNRLFPGTKTNEGKRFKNRRPAVEGKQ